MLTATPYHNLKHNVIEGKTIAVKIKYPKDDLRVRIAYRLSVERAFKKFGYTVVSIVDGFGEVSADFVVSVVIRQTGEFKKIDWPMRHGTLTGFINQYSIQFLFIDAKEVGKLHQTNIAEMSDAQQIKIAPYLCKGSAVGPTKLGESDYLEFFTEWILSDFPSVTGKKKTSKFFAADGEFLPITK